MDWWHVQLWQDRGRAGYHKRANKTKPLNMKWRNFHPSDLLFGCLEWNTHRAKIALKPCPFSWLRVCHFHPWKHYLKRLPCLQCLKDFQKHNVLGAGTIPSRLNHVVWLNLNAESFPLISSNWIGESKEPKSSPKFILHHGHTVSLLSNFSFTY